MIQRSIEFVLEENHINHMKRSAEWEYNTAEAEYMVYRYNLTL